MTVPMTNIDQLSLRDLRSRFRGDLPTRDVSRFANLGSKAPLELLDSVADFAFLGKKVTSNKNARNFLSQLGQLSGTNNDGNIAEFKPELTEVKVNDFFPPRQVLFLKPIKSSIKPEEQFATQSPVIAYDFGDEIYLFRPSIASPGEYLVRTINKKLNNGKSAEEILIEFIMLKNEENLPFGTQLVYGKGFDSDVVNAVKEKMKSF